MLIPNLHIPMSAVTVLDGLRLLSTYSLLSQPMSLDNCRYGAVAPVMITDQSHNVNTSSSNTCLPRHCIYIDILYIQ